MIRRPKPSGRDGFAGDFADGFDIGYGAGLVEPQRVAAFDGMGDGGGIAGGERAIGAEDEVAVFRELFDEGGDLVLILFALIAGPRFGSGDIDGAEGGHVGIGEGADLVAGGSAEYAVDGGFDGLAEDVEQGHVEGAADGRRAIDGGIEGGRLAGPFLFEGFGVLLGGAGALAPAGEAGTGLDAQDGVAIAGDRLAKGKPAHLLNVVLGGAGGSYGGLRDESDAQARPAQTGGGMHS